MHSTMTPETEAAKWSSAVFDFISDTCALPAVMLRQNVLGGKRSINSWYSYISKGALFRVSRTGIDNH